LLQYWRLNPNKRIVHRFGGRKKNCAKSKKSAADRSGRTMRRRSRRSRRLRRYRDNGGATDQRTQLSTARWPCVPNSRWQLSFMRCMGSSRSQAVKRTSDNAISNILIRLGGGQSGVTCQVHNSPNFTSTSSKIFDMWLACATLEEIAAAAFKRACAIRQRQGPRGRYLDPVARAAGLATHLA
jgi:hypothetical protein